MADKPMEKWTTAERVAVMRVALIVNVVAGFALGLILGRALWG